MALKSKDCSDKKLAKALTLAGPIKRGKSAKARLLQELLRINGHRIGIDGDFGPITRSALDDFVGANQTTASNSVGQPLLDLLAQPLLRAVEPIKPKASLGATAIAIAKNHLKEHPIEVGGANMGPWVRLYMDGNQGTDWPWCAGFVTYIVRAAAQLHGVDSPTTRTFSCDVLAMKAKQAGRFEIRGSYLQAASF